MSMSDAPDRPWKKRKTELRSLTPLSLSARVNPTNLRITPADSSCAPTQELFSFGLTVFSGSLQRLSFLLFERAGSSDRGHLSPGDAGRKNASVSPFFF